MSRTENSLRNIKVSLFFEIVRIFVKFFTRRVFVRVLAQEYLGLNGTFADILTMLSLAELGVGIAITFRLYKPLAEHDEEKVVALMGAFRRIYWGIGVLVALLGSALAPFITILIKELSGFPHIHLIYLLFVLNSSLSYFFVYKQSLIIADQRQYIVATCHALFNIASLIAQAIALWITGNYFLYLGLQIGMTVLENLCLSYIADRLYPYIRANRHVKLDPEERREIIKSTKAIIIHKISAAAVFSTDNLLISGFVGVIEAGLYSNYRMIVQVLSSIYGQLFSSLTASIGNLGATEDSGQVLRTFRRISLAGNWLHGFSSVCLMILFNPFIELWVGADYLFPQEIVALIVLNFYVTGMRQAGIVFFSAQGLFWYDRFKAIAEAIINLAASVALVGRFGIVGILAGTFISTITTCFWVEPVVLFKRAFHASVKPYFRDYAVNTAITLLTIVLVQYICALLPGTGIGPFIGKIAVCAVAGNAGFLLAYCGREEFRYYVELLKGMLVKRFAR